MTKNSNKKFIYQFISNIFLVSLGIYNVAHAVPVVPSSYSYLVPPQGGNPYPDASGNELNDNIYPTVSWGTGTVRNYTDAAPYSGWQYKDPQIVFNFDRVVDIGSLTLTADDANGAAGVYFPQGVTIDMGGKQIRHSIADPQGAGATQETISGLNLTGTSLTLTVDGGDPYRNWTMLGEVDFDTSSYIVNGYSSGVHTTVDGRIDNYLGSSLSQLVINRDNNSSSFSDPDTGQNYTVDTTGRLVELSGAISSSVRIYSEVKQSINDAFTEATLQVAHDFNDDGSVIDQLADAMGNNRAHVASGNGGLFGASLQSSVRATSGWWDSFIINGGTGQDELTLYFDVEGKLSGDNAGISFSLDAESLDGDLLVDATPFSANQSSHGGKGFFTEKYMVTIPFEYGEIFQISALLEIFSSGNSSVDFLDTVKVSQFVLPDGASISSSAIDDGLISADNYHFIQQSQLTSVPEPPPWILLLAGAPLFIREALRKAR